MAPPKAFSSARTSVFDFLRERPDLFSVAGCAGLAGPGAAGGMPKSLEFPGLNFKGAGAILQSEWNRMYADLNYRANHHRGQLWPSLALGGTAPPRT